MDASKLIDEEIARHPDWRGRAMAEIRRIVRETVPDVTEEVKWRGTPTWSRDGILCICNAFKDMVKVTFYNGAKLGLDGLFNAELGGKKWRAIKIFEANQVDARALKRLLLAAVALNAAKAGGRARPAAKGAKAGARARAAPKAGRSRVPKRSR